MERKEVDKTFLKSQRQIKKEAKQKKVKLSKSGRQKQIFTKTRVGAALTSSLAGVMAFVFVGTGGAPPPTGDQKDVVSYSISYNANDGTGAVKNINVDSSGNYTFLTAQEAGISKIGYELLGWSFDSDATEAFFLPGDKIKTKYLDDILIFAVWKYVGAQGEEQEDGSVVQKGAVDIVLESKDALQVYFIKGANKGEQLQNACLGGIKAYVGETEVTDQLFVKEIVFGENFGQTLEADELDARTWNTFANEIGTLKITVSIENTDIDETTPAEDRYITINRTIYVVSTPEIILNLDNLESRTTWRVEKNTQVNLSDAILAVFDESDAALTKDDITITIDGVASENGTFVANEVKDYEIEFIIVNKHGQKTRVPLTVAVVRPIPSIGVFGTSLNYVTSRLSSKELKDLVLDGVFADDGASGFDRKDISDQIKIETVNGTAAADVDWQELGATLGNIRVVLSVTNEYSMYNYLTRTVTIKDVPRITFQENSYIWESMGGISWIRMRLNETFSLDGVLGVEFEGEPAVTANDIQIKYVYHNSNVEISHNVTSVIGNYDLILTIAEIKDAKGVVIRFGTSMKRHIYVREKYIHEYNVFDVYNIIQNNLMSEEYTAIGKGQYYTSMSGSGYYPVYTETVNTPSRYYNMQAMSGSHWYGVGNEDNNRAVMLDYNKQAKTALFKRDTRGTKCEGLEYFTGYSFTTDNGVITPEYGYENKSYDMNRYYVKDFGKPFSEKGFTDGEYYIDQSKINENGVSSQYTNATKIITKNDGSGQYEIVLDIDFSNDSSSSFAAFKNSALGASPIDPTTGKPFDSEHSARTSALQHILNKPLMTWQPVVGKKSFTYARLIYTIDSNFRVISKEIDETFRSEFCVADYVTYYKVKTVYDYKSK